MFNFMHNSSNHSNSMTPTNGSKSPSLKDYSGTNSNTNDFDTQFGNSAGQIDVDTFDHILEVTSQHEAVYAYYYMDDNNKVCFNKKKSYIL